jgi:flagellar biosynthesis protein FlhA
MSSQPSKAIATAGPENTKSAGLTRLLSNNDILFAIGLAVVLATLLIPMPVFFMDMLLACNIAISIATLIITLSANESIEFSTFPSMLLSVTLFRLSLNVASTRLILLNGNAGDIITTFGKFVTGGNLVIGMVIFLILVIIQFVVITKGAERISEVAARFNLDAMPGKQMAIDADLNAGLIGEEEARNRRQKIVKESEFYGAMDGASKFIRGDAIAGLVIVSINLVGGFAVGMVNGMTASAAIAKYAILAIGDGLVSQIPAVIIATASGFLISKTSTQSNISNDMLRQFLAKGRPLGIAAFLMGAMVLVPGFPRIPFAVLAIGCGIIARVLTNAEKRAKVKPAVKAPAVTDDEDQTPVEDLLDVDKVSIQVSPRLVKTVDPRRKGSLSHRISPLRRKFAQQYGVLLPLVRLRDNVTLPPNAYEIRLCNHVIGSGQLEPDKFMAMDPGSVKKKISGTPAQEPVFNLPALWITAGQKDEAELSGYTVVDPETVLVTHLSEALRRHAHEILSRDDVQKLVDRLREKQPTLINGVIGDVVPMGVLHRVLQNLLKDSIPIRDLPQIIETLADHAPKTKDPAVLTELARKVLARAITEYHCDSAGKILAIVLAPAIEHTLRTSMGRDADGGELGVSGERAMELTKRVIAAWKVAMDQGHDKTVMLCDYRIRAQLASMLGRALPQLPVLAYNEISAGTNIQTISSVTLPQEIKALEMAAR